ncbi:hypothetical protein BDN70DRAFT_895317 [Pholiota conissans]|uniref:Uncharacterized protein n=1 Tax=Pholiota conissans TaxID=109636 RepID=A0A9P5Z0F5_9AGAR|nr:hypothetical protein BDN70DRAFT_895317 [Pholiota conissans]
MGVGGRTAKSNRKTERMVFVRYGLVGRLVEIAGVEVGEVVGVVDGVVNGKTSPMYLTMTTICEDSKQGLRGDYRADEKRSEKNIERVMEFINGIRDDSPADMFWTWDDVRTRKEREDGVLASLQPSLAKQGYKDTKPPRALTPCKTSTGQATMACKSAEDLTLALPEVMHIQAMHPASTSRRGATAGEEHTLRQ